LSLDEPENEILMNMAVSAVVHNSPP